MTQPVATDWQACVTAQAQFRAVFEHAPMGQEFIGTDGLVKSVNEAMLSMLGYREDEVVGRPAAELIAPESRAQLDVEAVELLEGKRTHVNAIHRMLHRDGHPVPVRLTVVVVRNDAGAPLSMVAMVFDLTDEVRTREQLQGAHEDALVSAERFALLHAIATAANEAVTLEALAPRVLRIVCDRLGWSGGALVEWSAQGPQLRHTIGHPSAPAEQPFTGDPMLFGGEIGPQVLVPLPEIDGACRALVFAVSETAFSEWQPEILRLVGIECGRVIERESAERAQRESDARFRSVFKSSPLAMGLTTSDNGTFTDVNDALCDMLGRTRKQLIGTRFKEIVHPDDVQLLDRDAAAIARRAESNTVEMRLLHSAGAVVISQVSLAWASSERDNELLLVQIEDITARRTAEIALRRQAEHDALTGLANRPYLMGVLDDLAGEGLSCSLLFVDLDGFKIINDTRGHDIGDEVLVEVARRLRAAVRPSDLVARLGGDEFVVLCRARGHSSPDEVQATARQVAERIDRALSEPIMTTSGAANVTASIGIASGELSVSTPQALLQQADTAMYQAKRQGKDRSAVYDAELHEETVAYHRTEAALRTALDDDRFLLHYQPIVELSGEVVGFEALVRLLDAQGQLVCPDRFISVAEQSGLIVPMGTWVLNEACRTIASLRERTGRPLTVSVNIAAQQLSRNDFADTVLWALEDSALPPNALVLELTESALIEADDITLGQLVALRAHGLSIGLDDFGTGYSSLAYLRRFPVSHLKVDRTFVAGMTTDVGDLTIVRAVTSLATGLGLDWIAEGVETIEQRDALGTLGSGLAQGYLFSRPVPAEKLPNLLAGSPIREPANAGAAV